MTLLGAPRHPTQIGLPSWARLRVDPNGRRYIRIDARSGPKGCITHAELFPHGETQAIMCSAMVRSTMLFGNALYEGISVVVQAYVRDSTKASGLRRVWQHRPDLEGKADLWVHETYADFTPIDFRVQMPENITPDFVRVVWISKGYSGQSDFTDFVVRDLYARTFSTSVAPTNSNDDYDFDYQLARDLFKSEDGVARSANIWAHYLATHVVRIKSGQPIDLYLSGEIVRATWVNDALNRVSLSGYIGLKCLRRKDGGSDWLFSQIGKGSDPTVLDGVANYNIRRPALNAYTQIEALFFVITPDYDDAGIILTRFDHDGFDMKITIDDSVESGTG